jgi:predicted RND superfamily exporter protein
LINFLLKYRIVIIAAVLVLAILFGSQIKKMGKDVSINSMLPADNPDFIYAEKMEDLFGVTDQFVIGVRFPDTVYTVKNLTLVKEISDFMENMPEINEDDVKSIFATKDVEGRPDELLVEKLLPEGETLDEAAVRSIRERVRNNPLFREKMVSADEKSAVVLAGISSEMAEGPEAAVLLKQIRAKTDALKAQNPAAEIYISGTPVILVNKSESMNRDLKVLFPVVLVLVMVLLFVLLRSLAGLFLPILVALFSITLAFGLKGLLGSPLTMAETMIPVMLIAICCADGVHIVSEFYTYRRQGADVRTAVVKTMQALIMPVILTSVTTALGFASLISSPGTSLKNMGLFMSCGVMAAMVFSLFLIPAVLSFKKNKPPVAKGATGKTHTGSRFQSFLQRVGEGVIAKRYLFLGMTVIVFVVSILGLIFLKVEAADIHFLKKTHPLYVATTTLEKYLGGVATLDIIVSGDHANFIAEPRIQRAIWDLQKFCERQKTVGYTLSVVDEVKRINYVMHANDPRFDRIPNETEVVEGTKVSGMQQIAQFLLLYEMGGGRDLEKCVDGDLRTARINVRLRDMGTSYTEQLLRVIKPYIAAHFPQDATVRYANHYKNYISMMLVVTSQLWSLLITLVTVWILMMLIYRSVANGLLVVIPTFITVMFNFAIMWIFNISLNSATAVIASVGMGVGIDYGIHYFARFKEELRQGVAYQKALIAAIVESGEGILFNAIAVGGGFLVLLLSDYHAIASLGWITAFAMVTTALSSLTLLPALLAIFKPKVKLGNKQRQQLEQAKEC